MTYIFLAVLIELTTVKDDVLTTAETVGNLTRTTELLQNKSNSNNEGMYDRMIIGFAHCKLNPNTLDKFCRNK